MNEQQQRQYADPEAYNPEYSYHDPRPINTDPREQPQWLLVPPLMTPPPPQPQRPHPWRWLGISVVILVVIFGGLFSASALLTHTISATQAFPVGSAPKLVVTADSGDVHIVSGASNQIVVVARERVFVGDNGQIPVQYSLSRDGETLTISVTTQPTISLFSFDNNSVDLDITVPGQTVLNVHDDSGDITSNGVNGSMSLTTSSGDVTTDGGSGQVSLTSSSGDVKASDVSGQMTLSTSSGAVTAFNAHASGTSTFATSSGDITFNGTLDPSGTYTFRDSSGDVDLTLPGDTAFQIQAATDSGDIDSAFPGVTVQHSDSGALASGGQGSGTRAQISIQTSSGDIHLHMA